MSVVLIFVGLVLVAVGIKMAYDKIGSEGIDGAAKGFVLTSPAWFGLIAVGSALAVIGVIRWEDRNPPKAAPAAVVEPDTFTLEDDELPPDVFDFGDDAYFDELYLDCLDGLWAQCDQLYLDSPVGSEYEYTGATCGYINDPGEFCVEIYSEGD